jgi:hypothetical protein
MPSAHAITIFWRIFTVVGLSILTVHILNVALGRESGRTSAPCPSLSHVFPEYAALSIRPQDAVAVIAEEKCGKRLARELRRALACNRVEVYTSEENLSRRTYDAVLIYGAGTHDAYRGLRAGIRVSKRLVAVWAQVSGAAQQQLMASVTPLDVSFVAATRHGIAITAELKDLAAAQRSRAVDILGHGSSGGAGTRYFLVWTTDAKGWGLLRYVCPHVLAPLS